MDAFPLPVEGTETRVNAGAGANEFMVTFTETCERIGTFCPCQCVWNLLKFSIGWTQHLDWQRVPLSKLSWQLMSPQKPQIHRISNWNCVAIIVGTWIFNWIYRTELMIPGCGTYCAFQRLLRDLLVLARVICLFSYTTSAEYSGISVEFKRSDHTPSFMLASNLAPQNFFLGRCLHCSTR